MNKKIENSEMEQHQMDTDTIPLHNSFSALTPIIEAEEKEIQKKLEEIREINETNERKRKAAAPGTENATKSKKNHQENETQHVAPTSIGTNTAASAATNPSNGTPSQTGDSREKPPPITIFNQDPKTTVKIISEILKIKNFPIKNVNENRHAVYLDNLSDHKKVQISLKSTQTNFFTYTPRC